jgi:hypothetical protein
VKNASKGVEVSMERSTVPDLNTPAANQQPYWPAFYHYPDIGLAATALNLDNDSIFGNLMAVYPYLRFHLVNLKWVQLNLKTGAGVSYLTKTFQDARYFDSNGTLVLGRSNAAIGSHLNVYFAMGGELAIPLGNTIELSGSLTWNHASNGSFYQPNSGLNILNGGLGFRYYPSAHRKAVEHSALLMLKRSPADLPVPEADDEQYKTGVEWIISGGARQLYYRDNKMFPTGALTLQVNRPVSRRLRLGIGIDGFYDGVFAGVNSSTDATLNTSRYKRTYLTNDRLINRFRGGMSLQPELMFGKLTAGFHVGVYLLNPLKNLEPYADAMSGTLNKGIIYPYDIEKEDGWLYTRASLKYSMTPHLLLHLGLKTHLQKAEFIEWGIGYRL